jgi:hypothetical protein
MSRYDSPRAACDCDSVTVTSGPCVGTRESRPIFNHQLPVRVFDRVISSDQHHARYILVLTNILGSPVLVLSNAFPPRVSQQVTLIHFVDRAWSKA